MLFAAIYLIAVIAFYRQFRSMIEMYDIYKAPVLARPEGGFAILILCNNFLTQSARAGRCSAVYVISRFRYVARCSWWGAVIFYAQRSAMCHALRGGCSVRFCGLFVVGSDVKNRRGDRPEAARFGRLLAVLMFFNNSLSWGVMARR